MLHTTRGQIEGGSMDILTELHLMAAIVVVEMLLASPGLFVLAWASEVWAEESGTSEITPRHIASLPAFLVGVAVCIGAVIAGLPLSSYFM